MSANTAPSFFAGSGKVTTAIGFDTDGVAGMAVQADGKFVVVGSSNNGGNVDFAVVRYNLDGSLDSSFSADGKLTTWVGFGDDHAKSVAIQSDGKILVAGLSFNGTNNDVALVRYNTDGSLDTTFSGDGKLTTPTSGDYEGSAAVNRSIVRVQTDGKILVASYGNGNTGRGSDFILLRYNSDGTLDTSFGVDGKVTTAIRAGADDSASSMVVQPDGKIIVSGSTYLDNQDLALVRYNVDGSLDSTFSGDGIATTAFGGFFASQDYGDSVALQADGKIVVAGSSKIGLFKIAVARYNSDGSLDTSFSGDGRLITVIGSADNRGNAVAIQADGKIVVAGSSHIGGSYSTDIVLVRYNADGSRDTTFSGDGKANVATVSADAGVALSIQADGKIVVAGSSQELVTGASSDFALARFNADGSLDKPFGAAYTLGGSASYTENGAPVVLDGSVALLDSELDALNGGAGNYAGAVVSLSRHGGASTADVFGFSMSGAHFTTLSDNTLQSGVQPFATYSQSGGVLTITFTSNGAIATNTLVDHVLEHITYSNASNAPPASVQIDWSLSDGNAGSQGTGGALSAVGSTAVNITAVEDSNTAPSFSSLGGAAANYVRGGNAILLDSGLSLGDLQLDALNAGAGDYAGASVTLARNGGASSDDVFGFSTAGASFSVSGNALQSGGQTFATYSLSGGTLSIAFTSGGVTASRALVRGVLEHVTYSNASGSPPTSVQINWTINDGNSGNQGTGGALTGTGSTTVAIVPNAAPVVSSGGALSVAENFTGVMYTATRTDANAGDTVAWSLGGADAARFALNATTGALSFNSAPNFEAPVDAGANNVYDVTLTATDGGGLSGSKALAITVVNANDGPEVNVPATMNTGQGARNQLSKILTATDAEGHAPVRFTITDNDATAGSAVLYANGAALTQGATVTVDASKLKGVYLYGGENAGTNRFTITADDGWAGGVGAPKTLDLVTRLPNRAPVVTPNGAAQGVQTGSSVLVTSFFTVSDADGDAITEYQLTETAKGGYFELNGVRVSGKKVTVSAADLSSMRYVAGEVSGSETLSIQASDGTAYGAKASFGVQSRGPNRTPVVTPGTSTQNVSIGSSVAVSSLFAVSDADGDTITQYRLTDGGTGGGYFELNGIRAATLTVTVSAADLATTRYVAAEIGSDTLTVEARDGTAFGAGASFDLVTQWVNRGPVVTPKASTQNVSSGGSVAVSSLFTVNDPNGDAITQYRLTDGSSNGKSGYFEVDGVRAPKGTITVSAANLAGVRYVAGTKDGSETLTIDASDGTTFGTAASFTVATRGKGPGVTPTASTQNVSSGGWVAVSSLFTVSDPDGDAVTHYELMDGGAGGGYLELNGVKAATQTVTVTAADLATTRYMAGEVAGSETLTIRASDGTAFGTVGSISLVTRGKVPVVTPKADEQPLAIGGSVAVSSLFTVNDPDGDAITQYRLTDGGPGGGYFELNGVKAATQTVTVSAANLATTRYVAGTVAGSETLMVEASDGTGFGAAASWSMQAITPLRLTEIPGSYENDTFGADSFGVSRRRIYFGNPGGDTFTASPHVPGDEEEPLREEAFLMGGQGGDVYDIEFGGFAVIFENRDGPGDVLAMPGFGFDQLTSFSGVVDGRHLFLGDLSTESGVLIIDWLAPENRIEHFNLSGGSYSFSEFSAALGGIAQIELTWADLGEDKFLVDEALAFYAQRERSLSLYPPPVNRAPVLTATNPGNVLEGVRRMPTGSFPGSLFSVSDPDGDTITLYEFTDSAGGGFFRIVEHPHFSISHPELDIPHGLDYGQGETVAVLGDQTSIIRAYFVPGPAGVADSFQVRAFDGTTWSEPIVVTMTPVVNHAPTLVAGGRTLKTPAVLTGGGFRQSVAVMDLYTPSDPDGPSVPYSMFIDDVGGLGGFLAYDGYELSAGVPFSPLELGHLYYYAGDFAGSETLTIWVSDGGLWTSQTVTMTTVVNDRPVVQATDLNATGETFNVLSLVSSVTDSDNSTFSLEVVVPSDLAPAQSSGTFSASQTGGGLTTYRFSGSTGLLFYSGNVVRDETISIRASDGMDKSEWTDATVHLDGTGSAPLFPGDNTFSSAVAVTLSPEVQTFHGSFGTTPEFDIVDYYRFTLDTQQTVHIQLNVDVNGYPVTVNSFKLIDVGGGTFSNGGLEPRGPQDAWVASGFPMTASMADLPAGTYSLELIGSSSRTSYDLSLSSS
jgi:uncharacterized delta-60 repeat protein